METSLLVAAATAAMVIMAAYLHRAYQGYLFSSGNAHGLQFDVRGTYDETQRLVSYEQTQDVDVTSGQQAVDVYLSDGSLRTIPGGKAASRILGVKARVTTDWSAQRDATYEAK